ncbi:MAG: DUF4266 domain-containing protein [Candidatus Eisenbacteria bacterium]|nr:DUF4266 domain-containing protein [Candidatus Eisenbacteria bacterium]
MRAAVLLAALAALTGGCAATIKPWDRDLMAQKQMSFIPIPMERAIDDHVYFSKEGSTGGSGIAGGGCGCN